ncbi:MAG: DNA mismatch repair protein MutS, partial [Nitrospirota bacterium]
LTPLLRQYQNIKKEHRDAILFFRMGDFYEMFFDDAVTASKILEIALTTRDKRNENPIPMCGIPYHAADSYLPKLIRAGHKVAICEQTEDPATAKGIVRREVIRVVSPGTVLDGNLLESKENNYIASISLGTELNSVPERAGLAFVDISTGDFYIAEISHPSPSPSPPRGEGKSMRVGLSDEIARIAPKELIVPQGLDCSKFLKSIQLQMLCINTCPIEMFEFNRASSIFNEHIKEKPPEFAGIDTLSPAINAAGALLNYLSETQKTSLRNINSVKVWQHDQYMIVDDAAQRTLELVKSSQTGQRNGTLCYLLDKTMTPMGGRLLRQWILNPLMDTDEIIKRQDAIEESKNNFTLRYKLRELLSNIHDMERTISRITLKSANARDLVSLNQCLGIIPELIGLLSGSSDPLISMAVNMTDGVGGLRKLISDAIVESPPLSITDGGIIRDGYNRDLDELREISREGKGWIARLEAKERQRSGIDSLKIRYNRVFGYYIEVTKAKIHNAPQDYIRKQTLVGAERFITPELKEYEEKVLGADDKIKRLEHHLFEEIRETAARDVENIQRSAKGIAVIDVISALAEAAHSYHYVRPVVSHGFTIKIKDGRHPVIEQMGLGERFVPNDMELDYEKNRLMVLTGPNMAGKSTYMRQAAIIVLMAQTGSFVPASEARIGVVDRI